MTLCYESVKVLTPARTQDKLQSFNISVYSLTYDTTHDLCGISNKKIISICYLEHTQI